MSTICYPSIKGLVMRATRLDSVGKWVTGTTGAAVSDGYVKIDLAANIEDGEEFIVKNAEGALCINEKDRSRLKWYDLNIEFCSVDPDMFEILTGVRTLDDWEGNAAGFTVPEQLPLTRVALEVWTKIPGATGNAQWVYWLLPSFENGLVGDFTIENAAATFVVTANSKTNANWGIGPYDVVAQDAGLTAGPLLDPVLADEHLYQRATEIAPPTAVCGYTSQLVGWTPYTP